MNKKQINSPQSACNIFRHSDKDVIDETVEVMGENEFGDKA